MHEGHNGGHEVWQGYVGDLQAGNAAPCHSQCDMLDEAIHA